jgi:hypothetical protein
MLGERHRSIHLAAAHNDRDRGLTACATAVNSAEQAAAASCRVVLAAGGAIPLERFARQPRLNSALCARRELLDQHGQTPAVMHSQTVKPVPRINAQIEGRARQVTIVALSIAPLSLPSWSQA